MEEKESKKPRVRDLLVWQSMSHPALNYPKGAFAVFGAMALFVSAIFILFQEWLAVLVTWAAYFLFYALTKVAPITVDHKITTEGIISMNHAYLWSELGPFWFTARSGEVVLHVAHRNIFGHLAILVDPKDQEKIKDTLAEYLPFIEVPEKSLVDKVSDWFSKKFPPAV